MRHHLVLTTPVSHASSGLACKSSPLRILDNFGIDKKTDIAPRPPWSVARVLAEKACGLTGLMMIDGQKLVILKGESDQKKGTKYDSPEVT